MPEVRHIDLPQSEIPRHWYNFQADIPQLLLPPLHPVTKQPVDPAMMERIFAGPLLEQEMSQQASIEIPDEVIEHYLRWRPTPLRRAVQFERALGTPAKIYFKDESVSPAGSHKLNTAVPQAYYNNLIGVKRIATETGAGQWGSSLALACKLFEIELKVYMVRISFEQKPYRKLLMQTWGAQCVPSPSLETKTGRDYLKKHPDTPGSLAIAISEALEDTLGRNDTRYALGSVLNHVLLHQTIIGIEAQRQLEKISVYPDIVIGCAGGGSNFAGISFPFARDRIAGKKVRIIASEPAACPTLTRGRFAYDIGDLSGMTPLLPMHTLGHEFVPPSLHAGGLRYHGMAPLVSAAAKGGIIEAQSYGQIECYKAGILWARTEGFVPAPETTHAIAAVVAEANRAKEEGKEKVILFNYSGHGLLDLAGYDNYLSGNLQNFELSDEEINASLNASIDPTLI